MEGGRRAAASRSPPKTSIDSGNLPGTTLHDLQSALVTRQWGSPLAIASSPVVARSLFSPAPATSMGHHPALSLLGFSPSVSSASSSRLMPERSADEHIVRRVSEPESSLSEDPPRRRCIRHRSHHSTDTPAHDLISSAATSWNECSTNAFASSSSLSSPLLRQRHRHHHHLGPYRHLSFPYRPSAVPAVDPLLLPSLSVELSRARSALGPVTGCLGAIRQPRYPIMRADTHLSPRPVDAFQDVEAGHEQQHPQHFSMYGSDQPSSFTPVAHHCTPLDRAGCSSSVGASSSGYQLNEGRSSIITPCYNNNLQMLINSVIDLRKLTYVSN